MRRRFILIIALAFALAETCFSGDEPSPQDPAAREQMIREMKELEKALGFRRSGNFLNSSDKIAAYYRCYYTGKLEIPSSYDDLQLKQTNQPACEVDSEKYDVFFYPIEAVANGKSPVTTSLQNSTMERLLVVVPHEDFHVHKNSEKLPASVTEAASTLIGFLTAIEFAQQKFGMASPVYQNLSKEPELFLRKAEVVNRYYPEFKMLYASARAGRIGREEALAAKQNLFARMEEECGAITPDPTSFNKCLAAANNAGLAFDYTYTKNYPLLYELFLAKDRQMRPTIEAIERVLAAQPSSEEAAIGAVRNAIEEQKRPASGPN
ncbi:MAG TPA: hypothetical protein VFA54_00080 [Bryobacterales bacterium]|jgi:hypothetical protein|nr:hypothetical protein [Bryobacterales bacterium]